MGIIYAGFDCLDPVALRESLQRGSSPVRTDHWYGKVNVYRTSLGLEPGTAKLLMSQRDLEQLVRSGDIDRSHTLEFSQGKSPPVKLKDLYVDGYRRIYPAAEDDLASAVMVNLVDKRGILKRIPVDKRYNVYECPCGEVLSTTKNGTGSGSGSGSGSSGSLWTWSAMVADLWAASSSLGMFPGLPFTPHGTPSNFVFEGMTLFEALTHVFTRLSVAPFYDPILGTWQIFRLGNTSDITRATQAVAAWTRAGLKVWDDFPVESTIAHIPEKARVTFRKQPLPTDGTSWEYHLDVAPTTALTGTAESGTVAILWDDLPAIYCSAGEPSASLANSSDLTARAAERATDYYRLQQRVLEPSLQAFKGVRTDSLLGLYGGAAVMMAIQDVGEGYKWELLGGQFPPGQDLEAWMPYQRFKLGDSCESLGSGEVVLRRESAGLCWLPCTGSGSGSSGSGSSGSGPAEFCVNGYKLVNQINLVDPRTNETVSTVCEDVVICEGEQSPCYEPPTTSICECVAPVNLTFTMAGMTGSVPRPNCGTQFNGTYDMAYSAAHSGPSGENCGITWFGTCRTWTPSDCGLSVGNILVAVLNVGVFPSGGSFGFVVTLTIYANSICDPNGGTALFQYFSNSLSSESPCMVPFPMTLTNIVSPGNTNNVPPTVTIEAV
jgi:hypothetical protein